MAGIRPAASILQKSPIIPSARSPIETIADLSLILAITNRLMARSNTKATPSAGVLNGDLLITQYAGGSNIVDISRNGATNMSAIQSIAGMTGFNEPLGIAEDDATGNLYVAQYGGKALTLLRVDETPLATTPAISATATQLVFNAIKGTSSATNIATVLNDGAQDLNISSFSIGGTNASDFKITTKPSTPATLQPGQSANNVSLQGLRYRRAARPREFIPRRSW